MSRNSTLIVQSCHLPQFFYIAQKLRQRYPQWDFDALVTDHVNTRLYLKLFPQFHQVHFARKGQSNILASYSKVIFPLLNQGYRSIKKTARSLSHEALETDYEGSLRSLNKGRLWRSFFLPLHVHTQDFLQYLQEFPHLPLGKRILFLETCHPSLVANTRRHWEQLILRSSQVMRIGSQPAWKLWKQLRGKTFDGAVMFFSGEKGFGAIKTLPFLLNVPKILIFNELGQYFYANFRSMTRFLPDRIRFGVCPPRTTPRVLFIQTELPEYVIHALQTLRKQHLFPRSEIALLCRHEDIPRFRAVQTISRVFPYSRGCWRNNLWLWRQLRGFRPDVLCAIFSGRPMFRKQKLFFLLSPTRRRLFFNAQLNCYELSRRTFLRLFRKEPLLFAPQEKRNIAHRILLIQTERDEITRRTIHLLKQPKSAPHARIFIFCSELKRPAFESLSSVDGVFTYRPGKFFSNLRILPALTRLRPDIVAAIFSGRPILRVHKLLFFLMWARNRLVFNENLDCFYLTWRNLYRIVPQFLPLSPPYNPNASLGSTFWRSALKVALFWPRFGYLLMWFMILQLKGPHGSRRWRGW